MEATNTNPEHFTCLQSIRTASEMAPSDNITQAMAKSFPIPDFSDMTIRCDGEEFPVHRIVVCGMSSVLDALCKINMRESKENVIDHDEFDATTVKRMLQYMYTSTYTLEDEIFDIDDPNTANDILLVHVRVYAIADYYDVLSLRLQARSRFVKQAEDCPQVEGFVNVVKEIYRRTNDRDEDLRPALHTIALDNIDSLRTDPAFVKGLVEDGATQGFAGEMVLRISECAEKERQENEEEVISLHTAMQADDHDAKKAQELEKTKMKSLIDQLSRLPQRCTGVYCGIPWGQLRVSWEDDLNTRSIRCGCSNRLFP
ncbi:hypothetical protein MBLNU230_g5771t1 [Neophaeotheca triangularis]